MEFDLMARGSTWAESADLAKRLEGAGFSGMLVTEASQVPWMMIAAASMAAPTLDFSTGIAVAFPRSPMMSAQIAWELARNTQGRFRLGLGSQVKAHITRRYASLFDRPAPQMKDYLLAFKACLRAFRREEALHHDGPYYPLSLLPEQWSPARHDYEDVKVDISAVGPYMVKVAGAIADGIHVHPMHSMPYIENRLLPGLVEGAAQTGRDAAAIDLIVPVFAIPGDSPEERAAGVLRCKTQIGFYGATPNYSFQFDDLGYVGMREKLRVHLKSGDTDALVALIDDEMMDHFGIVARWDDLADQLIARYLGKASRVVMYLAEESIRQNPDNLGKWSEIARAVRAAA
ncbi:MAG: TIGR03617 family F420-dependent LLM class oxidoreductase [Rhodospirillaceae bacterium]|jgi:probable F420-dependent oxidoreductase|nr:TIGR03617 family F420-dependent LLM class oxidoreductase [Rhodospirillaceae bacterium]MBT4045684.1 TIGR03617 family F420-dependent LLM class oxidoreductase [Rhodospirillaceae bacterium]MBT4686813.1 TIGR03617 family F420-dependent LLM class oxidoreductase [Rhodospirillaceae bacterium]MBT5081917.1 TIGR03617 family F420-dependent LLM class oxidoreductase [Rhodospirillaceae bacterium]MBT5523810.1 TIGR03617 family F420-dependent LLM class oxidoreductase [Rhodospirillaceae bacterium]